MHVLVVDDDHDVRSLLLEALAAPRMVVTVAGDVRSAVAAIRSTAFDVVLLELRLPDGSGLDVLGELRERGSLAHVIALGTGSLELERVEALDRGADDVVAKPFSVRELTARIDAVGRRRGVGTTSDLRFGELELTVASRRVRLRGEPVTLTAKEFDLLAFFAAHPDRAHSRDELLQAVWRSAADWQQAATVTEHVRRLRNKIEEDPVHPVLVRTVHGVGYRFDPGGADR